MRSLEARRESVTEAWVRAWARRAGVLKVWWIEDSMVERRLGGMGG
jgi:hypothetical protein